MNDVRRQHRKDRKASRAQERIDKKASRAKAKDENATRPKRIVKLVRTPESEVVASRSRIVGGASAFGGADLQVVRAMLVAVDALLESSRPEDVERVRAAAALIVGRREEAESAFERPSHPAPELERMSTPVLTPAPAKQPEPPAPPVLIPSFLLAPPGETRTLSTAAPVSHPSPPPPAPVPAAPPSAPIGMQIEEESTQVPDTSPPVTASSTAPTPPARADQIGALSSTSSSVGAPAPGLPFAPSAGVRADPLARFPIGVYASVCAELQARPHLAKGILDRYGLSDPALREAVDRGHRERIASDPVLRVQFDEMVLQARIALQR